MLSPCTFANTTSTSEHWLHSVKVQNEAKTFIVLSNPDAHHSDIFCIEVFSAAWSYPWHQCYLCSDGISVQRLRLWRWTLKRWHAMLESLQCLDHGSLHAVDLVVFSTAMLRSDEPFDATCFQHPNDAHALIFSLAGLASDENQVSCEDFILKGVAVVCNEFMWL